MQRGIKRMALAAMTALICAGASWAGEFKDFNKKCGDAPYAPSIKMDASITDAQMTELRKDVLDFIKASDQFQECISRIIEAGPEFKKEDDTSEKRIAIAKRFDREASKIVEDNQSEKERVGEEFNKLVELRKSGATPK